MPAPHPRMHGLTHVPGGPDPIPLLPSIGSGFPELVLSSTSLRGYWRLGEALSNFLDTSGYNPAHPANLTVESHTTHLTRDVVGGIVDDDGSVQFNKAGTGSEIGVEGDFLDTVSIPDPSRFQFSNSDGREMTVAGWIKPGANANTVRAQICGVSDVQTVGGTREVGWGLQMTWPSRKVRFTRAQNGVGNLAHYAEYTTALAADTWYFVAGTYDSATINLYVNGELVASTPDTRDISSGAAFTVGGGNIVEDDHATSYFGYFLGGVDEVAVWSRVLTAPEILKLYNGGALGAATDGWVLTSDGAGGASWQPPPTGGGGGGGGGTELAYVEFTSNVTVSSTTEATPTDVVSAGAVTYAAARIRVDFCAAGVLMGGSNGALSLTLWDGSTDLGRIGSWQQEAASGQVNIPTMLSRFLTPSAGSHTYKIRGFSTNSSATILVGAGGTGVRMPGWIRVSLA